MVAIIIVPLNRTAWQKTVAGVLVLWMAASPLIAQGYSEQPPEADSYDGGYLAGKRDAKDNPGWIFSGLFLGPIGLVLPWVISPKVPGGNLIGKSAAYVEGYTKAYKKRAKKKNFEYSLAGCGVFAVIGSIISAYYGIDKAFKRLAMDPFTAF